MKCDDFEKVVITLARDQLMDAGFREQSRAHAEICSRCGRRLRGEQNLLLGINAVLEELAYEAAPSQIEIALLAAFRAQTHGAASSIVVPGSKLKSHSWNWKVAAVAAGILILISVMAIVLRSLTPFKPPRDEQAVSPQRIPVPQPPSLTPEREVAVQPKERPKRSRRPALNPSDETEFVTRFLTLREGEDLSKLESMQLVRVELPSSALGELGLPIDFETANEPVKADVLVGQDGLARAIRFVR